MMHSFDIKAARKALTDPRALVHAFVWSHTPQGFDFWASEEGRKTVSPEAREILEKMIADHETANKETSVMFEPGKEYKMRDGRKVRIYATDAGGEYPVHGAYFHGDKWYNISWTKEGKIYKNDHLQSSGDIMPPEPEKVMVWVNIYPGNGLQDHDTRESADRAASLDRIACVPLTYFKGEGL